MLTGLTGLADCFLPPCVGLQIELRTVRGSCRKPV